MKAIVSLVGGFCCLVFIGCGARSQRLPAPAPSPRESSEPAIQVQTETLHLKWFLPGQPSQLVWEARVPRAEAQQAGEQGQGVFEQVRCTLYDKGKPLTDLQAGRVHAVQQEWRIEASQGVFAHSRVNDVRLRAERVVWFARQNRLVAEGSVEVRGKQFYLRAQRVEMDTALQQMRVSAP